MNETISEYLAFLWQQFQNDWVIFTDPWILYTIVPAILYLVFFVIKWYILLIPVTLPLSLIGSRNREVTIVKGSDE